MNSTLSNNMHNQNKNIKLDVGGKKIKIPHDLIVKSDLLKSIVKNTSFLDMDPVIFNYVLEVLRSGNIQTHHHKKYNNTLVRLGLLDKNLYLKPKIVLANPFQYKEQDKFKIIKLILRGKKFKTFKCTLVKCPLLVKELAKSNGDFIFLDKDYKAFSYILNLLRNNETCFFPKTYFNELDSYEIGYYTSDRIRTVKTVNQNQEQSESIIDRLEKNLERNFIENGTHVSFDDEIESNTSAKNDVNLNEEIEKNMPKQEEHKNNTFDFKIDKNFIKHSMDNKHEFLQDTYNTNETSMKSGLLQITSNNTKIYDKELKTSLSKFYAYSDRLTNPFDKIYSHSSVDQYFNLLPTHSIIHQQIKSQKYSIVEKEVSVDFGKTLVFDLPSEDHGDMIDDMIIIIDLDPLYAGRWVNHLGNMIIKRLYFNLNKETVINLTGEFLDIKNKLYLQNGSQYDYMNIIYDTDEEGNRISRKYNRIMLPIKLSEKIPITKENVKMLLYIELQDQYKCVIFPDEYDGEDIGGGLVNLSILTNYINLSVERPKIINNTNMYVYNNVKLISKNISTINATNDYCLTVIPLNSFDYIKDLVIVIHSYEDIENHNYFKYTDDLLDAELMIGNDTLFKLDKMMMNKYLPLKYFKKVPDSKGIYYYSFSTDPLSNKLFGGYNVHFKKEYKTNLLVRTNKINGVIHVYSNNYFITNL